MKEQLATIRSEALAAFAQAGSSAELDALRVKYLGKKGELTAVLKQMGKLSAEERPAMGQLANEVRAALEAELEAKGKELEAKALEARLEAEALDVTVPGTPCISPWTNSRTSSSAWASPYWTDPRWSWPS